MRRVLTGFLLSIGFLLAALDGAHGQECPRLALKLDRRLTAGVVRREWASGNARVEANAVLELRGCRGQLLDRLPLGAPLAQLDLRALRGTRVPTYLVSVDLTMEAGSYNGPLTLPVEVEGRHLRVAEAVDQHGQREAIHLALTGKAAWKKVAVGAVNDLLSVSCQPQDGSFVTFYRRYQPTPHGWRVRMRSEGGLWESDGDFPALRLFP